MKDVLVYNRSPPPRYDDSSAESDGGAAALKTTRFIVTMSKKTEEISPKATAATRPSVKSRLGPRINSAVSDAENLLSPSSSIITDAREILIAKSSGNIGEGAPIVPIILEDSDKEEDDFYEDQKPNKDHIPRFVLKLIAFNSSYKCILLRFSST